MEKFVITISRETGAGGLDISRMLSEKLRIPYYDRDLLRYASDFSGINVSLFGLSDERIGIKEMLSAASKVYTGEILPPDSDDYLSTRNLFSFQAKVIKQMAEDESCVILGRAANYLLRDKSNVLKVFLYAPAEWRQSSVKNRNKTWSKAEIVKYMNTEDKRRSNYYRYFTGENWRDAAGYDLCIDVSKYGLEGAVELISKVLGCYVG